MLTIQLTGVVVQSFAYHVSPLDMVNSVSLAFPSEARAEQDLIPDGSSPQA